MSCIELRTRRTTDQIALRGVRLTARLVGMSLRATVEQTFVNLERGAIEAVYTFPLPEGAAVCGFEVLTGDRVLTGAVEESGAAAERYDDAVADGHGAFVLEQDRPDVFTVRVGNLKPRQAATIRLSYVAPLERVDRSIRVAFPTTVAPRYVTATDPIEAAVDGDALNPPHVLHVPYGLSASVDVDLGRAVKSVASPSHSVAVEAVDGDRARRRVTLVADGRSAMDRDFVVLVELEREHAPSVQVARGPEGESYLAVSFVPEFETEDLVEPAPTETVFVLDCSGSMQGESMAQATAALGLCLRSLGPRDTFNVCRFGSTWELLASEPLAYGQKALDRALAWIGRGANLGGTELYPPLEAVLRQKPRAGTVRQVILLTDGQVTNEPAVVELARTHRGHNRIFSFGIGSACSAFLVKGVARATGGAAEFVTAGERIDDKVLRTFARVASPPTTDVSLDWDGCDVQTLAELPPVFDGDVFCAFGRAPARVPAKVRLSCRTPHGPREWTVPVPRPTDDGGVIATMWARRMIQSLEEVNGVHERHHRPAEASREREMLISVSKRHGLLCSLTTFVAIEHRSLAERNEGQPALRRVPVMLAEGWGEVLDEISPGALCAPCAAPPRKSLVRGRTLDRLERCIELGDVDRPGVLSRFAARWIKRDTEKDVSGPSQPPSGASDPLYELLARQAADGSFEPGDPADPLVPAEWLDVVRGVSGIKTSGGAGAKRVVATAAALLVLRHRFGDREVMWSRASRKALTFLATSLSRSVADVARWLDEVFAKLPGAGASGSHGRPSA